MKTNIGQQGCVANPRPVASAVSVIGCVMHFYTRPILILATGLGFATRPRFILKFEYCEGLRSDAAKVIAVWMNFEKQTKKQKQKLNDFLVVILM